MDKGFDSNKITVFLLLKKVDIEYCDIKCNLKCHWHNVLWKMWG